MGFESAAPILFESVSNVTATLGANSPELGTRINKSGNEWTFVYNAGGEQIAPRRGVIVSAVSGYSVSVSSVTQASKMFGVCVNATATTGTYFWAQTGGFVDIKNGMASTALAAAELVELGADGVFVHPPAAATAAGHHTFACGYIMAATGSAGTAGMFISGNK
jgi:hypothetical protein